VLGGGGWSAPHPSRFMPGKDLVPTVQEARLAPGPVWTGAKNLTPTGIRFPDCSQSLYRLSYVYEVHFSLHRISPAASVLIMAVFCSRASQFQYLKCQKFMPKQETCSFKNVHSYNMKLRCRVYSQTQLNLYRLLKCVALPCVPQHVSARPA
jgi:hypothetical protein